MTNWYEFAALGLFLCGAGFPCSKAMITALKWVTKDKETSLGHAIVQILLSWMLIVFGSASLFGAGLIMTAVIKLIS